MKLNFVSHFLCSIRYLFTSEDCGATFSSHKLDLTPELVEFDAAREKVFLVHDLMDDAKRLYVSKVGFELTSCLEHRLMKSIYSFFRTLAAPTPTCRTT